MHFYVPGSVVRSDAWLIGLAQSDQCSKEEGLLLSWVSLRYCSRLAFDHSHLAKNAPPLSPDLSYLLHLYLEQKKTLFAC